MQGLQSTFSLDESISATGQSYVTMSWSDCEIFGIEEYLIIGNG